MDDEHQEAVNFLNDFFINMNAWGIRVISLYTNDPGGPQGNQEKMRSELKQIFEKSLAVNKKLPQGHILKIDDLEAKKPKGYGIDAAKFMDVVGKRLTFDKNKWDFLNEEDIQ